MAPLKTGRETKNSVAKKREVSSSNGGLLTTGPVRKRRFSFAGVVKAPSAPRAPTKTAHPSALASAPKAPAAPAGATEGDASGQGNVSNAADPSQTNRGLGDVAEKRLRSFKDVKDNIDFLIRQRNENRQKALALGQEAGIQKWLLDGNRLRTMYRGDKPLTDVEETVNRLVEMTTISEALNKQIEAENKVLFKLSIDKPGKAAALDVKKGEYAEDYTLEEALRRPSPLKASAFISDGPSWLKPRPVLNGIPIDMLVEGGPGWKAEWNTLDNPDMDLDKAIREARASKERLSKLPKNAPKETLITARKNLHAKRRVVHEILYIRQYFCNGYTVHPNQIVSPKQLPREGLCSRWILYFISLCLRHLISIRDNDTQIGLHMSPLDMFRWRIAAFCKDHDHASQKGADGKSGSTIRACIKVLYHDDLVKGSREGDAIFRMIMLHAAKVERRMWKWNRHINRDSKDKKKACGSEQKNEDATAVEDQADEHLDEEQVDINDMDDDEFDEEQVDDDMDDDEFDEDAVDNAIEEHARRTESPETAL